MKRLEGKVALITGAAQAIGAVMAQHMAEHGAKVFVTGQTVNVDGGKVNI